MLTYGRAEFLARAFNGLQNTYTAEVVPGPATTVGEQRPISDPIWCVTIYEANPELVVLCTFADGEVMYESQEASYVIDEWNGEALAWVRDVIANEVNKERQEHV